jgi:hypothetical protein
MTQSKRQKKISTDDWLAETVEPVVGKQISSFQYRRASQKQQQKLDTLVLLFSNGELSISPDPVGDHLELAVWFTPKSK